MQTAECNTIMCLTSLLGLIFIWTFLNVEGTVVVWRYMRICIQYVPSVCHNDCTMWCIHDYICRVIYNKHPLHTEYITYQYFWPSLPDCYIHDKQAHGTTGTRRRWRRPSGSPSSRGTSRSTAPTYTRMKRWWAASSRRWSRRRKKSTGRFVFILINCRWCLHIDRAFEREKALLVRLTLVCQQERF